MDTSKPSTEQFIKGWQTINHVTNYCQETNNETITTWSNWWVKEKEEGDWFNYQYTKDSLDIN